MPDQLQPGLELDARLGRDLFHGRVICKRDGTFDKAFSVGIRLIDFVRQEDADAFNRPWSTSSALAADEVIPAMIQRTGMSCEIVIGDAGTTAKFFSPTKWGPIVFHSTFAGAVCMAADAALGEEKK